MVSFNAYLRTKRTRSGLICLVGILIGLILRELDDVREFIAFSPEVFFTILLPPIIFYAGYSLHKEHGSFFFSNIGTITLFAVAGTLISTVSIAVLCYISSFLSINSLSFVECWLFGTLISAIDPVATISIFENFKIQSSLFNLVFGESVLNDAVAIVLFRTVNRFTKTGAEVTVESFFFAVFEFVYVSAGSVAIGVLFGLAFSLSTKHMRLHGDLPTLSLLMMAYLAYILAELADLSGIFTILTFGIVTSHYAWLNLSNENQLISYTVSRMLGRTSESFVFAYIGMSVFAVTDHHVSVPFIILAYIFCQIGRAANIFPISTLVNRWRTMSKSSAASEVIGKPSQLVMFFSGLRGAIAFALALDVSTEHQHTIKTTTLAIVLLSTFMHGGATLPMLRKLGIVDERKDEDGDSEQRADGGDDCGDSVSSTQEYFLKWDRKYLTPLFCRAEAIPAERKYCIDGHHEDVGAISVSDEDCFSLLRSSRWTGDGPLEDRAVGMHKKKGALQALDAERDRAPANAQVESTVL